MIFYIVLVVLLSPVFPRETTVKDYRKLYGMNFHGTCRDYFMTFKCMTACKSQGFEIYRLDFKCKCTCHEMKSSTVLPYFKWRTTRPTRAIPETYSVSLYHIIGTLSPAPTESTTEVTTQAPVTCPPVGGPSNDTSSSTTPGGGGSSSDNTTTSTNTNVTTTDNAVTTPSAVTTTSVVANGDSAATTVSE